MKVLTIGRCSDNDIVVNDPYVGRHHCQIVQHDNGSFSLIDLDSTNGTFKNGQRINGTMVLGSNDVVRIGNSTLDWKKYFPPTQKAPKPKPKPKRKSKLLPVGLGIAAALVVVIVLLVVGDAEDLRNREILYKGPEPPTSIVTLVEDGVSYDVDAAEGQVVVLFNETVSYNEVLEILKKNNAKIIAQMPDVQYYLVEVSSGSEGELFSSLRNIPEVDYVYPKTIDVLCSATPYIFDNFSHSDHGSRVVTMLGNCFSSYKKIDLGIDERSVSNYAQPLVDGLKKLTDKESAVINMSFGPPLIRLGAIWPNQKRPLWNERLVTEGNQLAYKRRYVNQMKEMIKLVDTYDDKDFVIVKSAGNEGMKELEVILDELKNDLSPKEFAVFERHFVIVSAKDDNKEADYPNDVKNYNKMVTKVDISDMTAKDLHWQGTSFSSPRTAGFITSVANSYDMKVTEVLKYVREATEKAPEHILTQELLEKAIEADKKNNSKETLEGEVTIDGILKMHLLDNDWNDNVISQYRETDWVNNSVAFVVNSEKSINVLPYLEEGDADFIDDEHQSSFMVLPEFKYNGREFADKYANKHVQATGTLYAPGGGWHNATVVVMRLRSIKLLEEDNNKKQQDSPNNNQNKYQKSSKKEYKYKMSCNKQLFESKRSGHIDLPNGDVINYQYRRGNDSDLRYSYGSCYYIRFTLANNESICKKYCILAKDETNDDRLWVGSGNPWDDEFLSIKPIDLPIYSESNQRFNAKSDNVFVIISQY